LLIDSNMVRNKLKRHRGFDVILHFRLTDVRAVTTKTALLFRNPGKGR
jgi:hypothetical protein